jgi:glyoxylase-like metal-dependent hydrolase (beta-lactamase superfamily II)
MIYEFHHGGGTILFSGDVFHSPIQVPHPDINSRWCEDQQVAVNTRHQLLKRAAAVDARILPAHIQGVEGWRVARSGEGFAIGFDRPPSACGHAHDGGAA